MSTTLEETCSKVVEILHHHNIGKHHTSEPYNQNQNHIERRIQDVKRSTDATMDASDTPACCWLSCTLFICGVFNHVAQPHLGGMSSITKATNQTVDISKCLHFKWFQLVFCGNNTKTFPSASGEKSGWWVGPAEDCGDVLTYQIFDANTHQVVMSSVVCPAGENVPRNL